MICQFSLFLSSLPCLQLSVTWSWRRVLTPVRSMSWLPGEETSTTGGRGVWAMGVCSVWPSWRASQSRSRLTTGADGISGGLHRAPGPRRQPGLRTWTTRSGLSMASSSSATTWSATTARLHRPTSVRQTAAVSLSLPLFYICMVLSQPQQHVCFTALTSVFTVCGYSPQTANLMMLATFSVHQRCVCVCVECVYVTAQTSGAIVHSLLFLEKCTFSLRLNYIQLAPSP